MRNILKDSTIGGGLLRDSHAGLPTLFGGRRQASLPPREASGLLSLAHEIGLPVLAGTESGGFVLHLELAMLVAEGLTPLEALQAATLNPAKMWRATDSLGTVAVGKLADLVLLDANPLTDIANTMSIRAVVANGRYFDRAALDSLLLEPKDDRGR